MTRLQNHPGAAGLLVLLTLTGTALAGGDGPEFLVDTTRQLVPSAAFEQDASCAFDGANHFVVWGADAGVRGVLVTPSGALVDSAGVLISSVAWSQTAVAWGGGVYLVAFEVWNGAYWDVYAARVTAAGQVLDPNGFPVSTAVHDQDEVDVAFDGTNFLVVWADYRAGSDTLTDIYGCRVTPAGSVLDPSGIPICTAAIDQVEPSVAFDGTNYFVVWADDRDWWNYSYDIYGARVAPSGVVLDPNGIRVTHGEDNETQPAIGYNGQDYLVVWTDANYGNLVYAARVSPAGVVRDTAGFRVASRSQTREHPRVGSDGTNWLVLWEDNIYSSSQDLYGARVSPAGAVLDPAGFAVSNAAFEQAQAGVSFDGINYLVAWQDQRAGGSESDIYVARVAPAGTVLDPTGLPASFAVNEADHAALASDGSGYLVVWSDGRGQGDIYGARVSAAGAVLDPVPFNISCAAGLQTWPTAAFDGTNYLVVWQDNRDTGNVNLYGARVSAAGAVIDSPAVRLTTTRYDDYQPRMTFDGVNYYVTWSYEWYHHVWAMRITPSLTVLDSNGFQVSFAASTQMDADIAVADTTCLIIWEQYPQPEDIIGARVTRSGKLLDSVPIRIATAPYTQSHARVASSGTNWLVVWADHRSLRHYDIYAGVVELDGTVRDTFGFAVAVSDSGHVKSMTDAAFAGGSYFLVWGDDRYEGNWKFDVFGAQVSQSGALLDTFPVAQVPDRIWYPALGSSGAGVMLAFTNWTGESGGRNYNGRRIWGKMGPLPGVVEGRPRPDAGRVLLCRPSPFRTSTLLSSPASGRGAVEVSLHDVAGRRVLELTGDLAQGITWDGTDGRGHRLPAGVYLCHVMTPSVEYVGRVVLTD